MTERHLVIGTGTGRCGTKALHILLNAQPQTHLTHEKFILPWRLSNELSHWEQFGKMCWSWGQEELHYHWFGDIAPWYLAYVPVLWDFPLKVKYVCLQRDRALTVASFLRQRFDYCSLNPRPEERPSEELFPTVPKFEGTREECAGQFWDAFYTQAQGYAERIPNTFRIFPTEALNSIRGQREILSYLGYSVRNMRTFQIDPRYPFKED